MIFIAIFLIIALLAISLIPFVEVKQKGIITLSAIIINVLISSFVSVRTLLGDELITSFCGSYITGEIPIRIDALSGWFMLIINFTFLTGGVFGFNYMKVYKTQTINLSIHCISFVLVHAMLLAICAVQNSLVLLFVWEIMALASFLLIIFEHQKHITIKAGINFLIQSHVCILFLTLGFIWVGVKMNSYDFEAITAFSKQSPAIINFALFACFFLGFAIKAGFVPFHTWLPYAHPAAPSHVSGIMSGVIIKIGIYGILRMLLLINCDYVSVGYLILFFSIISGVYGVMLAILQHNLKKLLAYHSIENIGIIGIGIGLGCIGLGTDNKVLILLGFAGALLHTLNHSLFKSLLFFGAGNVYQSTHTMNIELLGGIVKRMPHTAVLFLVAALAICGLPPFNGFVSEFLIYFGMLNGLKGATLGMSWTIAFSMFSLALIGGLAILCFTKAYGTVFLGTARSEYKHTPVEAHWMALFPMYAVLAFILLIGIFPKIFIIALSEPLYLFVNKLNIKGTAIEFPSFDVLNMIGLAGLGMIGLSSVIFLIRRQITKNRPQNIDVTWSCGYVAPNSRMQYTASSFTRTYRKLAEILLSIEKDKVEIKGVFPHEGKHETHPYDKSELWLIDYPIERLHRFINAFSFLQNGYLQVYIIYGVVFIASVIVLPLIYEKIVFLIHFLSSL